MIIFKETKGELVSVKQKGFRIEKELQNLIEKNLNTIFGIQMIQSEFTFKNRRFDTLCFDEESKSFVIIEYKNKENTSVIDQGFSYLSLLLNNKSDFLLRLSHHFNKVMKLDDVEWSSSKVIFISPKFTPYQKESVNFKDIPFELWELKRFEGGLVGLTQLFNDSTENISGSMDFGNSVIEQVTKEIKSYDLNFHTENIPDEIIDLYEEVDRRIMGLGDVKKVYRRMYIGYKTKSNFVDIRFNKKNLWMWVNLRVRDIDIKFYESLGIRDVSSIGHYGNGDFDLHINLKSDINLLMSLIKRSYDKQS